MVLTLYIYWSNLNFFRETLFIIKSIYELNTYFCKKVFSLSLTDKKVQNILHIYKIN